MLEESPLQSPHQRASFPYPSCCRWIRSDLANTAHRVAMLGGSRTGSNPWRSRNSKPSRAAWASRNDPVPAALEKRAITLLGFLQ